MALGVLVQELIVFSALLSYYFLSSLNIPNILVVHDFPRLGLRRISFALSIVFCQLLIVDILDMLACADVAFVPDSFLVAEIVV
jgi:hypothetical protein